MKRITVNIKPIGNQATMTFELNEDEKGKFVLIPVVLRLNQESITPPVNENDNYGYREVIPWPHQMEE